MLHFAWPWLFLILPLPWLIRWLLPRAKMMITEAIRLPHFAAVAELFNNQITAKRKSFIVILLIAWLSLIVAAANPQWLGKAIALPTAGRDIMLAVDLSGSMRMPDMVWHHRNVTRLQVVKALGADFIKSRQGDRLGLILFGTRAYLQTPLTFDAHTVAAMLQDASSGLAGQYTAIGDAIGLAIKRLQHSKKGNRVLILLTDGQSNTGAVEPLAAAKMAAKYGIRIYTIGLGAKELVVPGFFGNQVVNPSQDLDVTVLKDIAKITGGLYFRAEDGADLQSIYRRIDAVEPVISDKRYFRPITHLYPWPLSLAVLLSFIAFLL